MELGVSPCKILIVGCSARVGVELCLQLGERGFSVIGQGFEELDETLDALRPDLVVACPLDDDPSATLARLRRRTKVPVVFLLPADHRPELRAAAFHADADDVFTESPDLSELVLRVETILRRRSTGAVLRAGDVTIDEAGHIARRGGHELDLTDIEFGLLVALAGQIGVVVSKRQLLGAVWGFENFDVNLVEVHVSALRRKLESFGPRIIDTVRGQGYVIRSGGRHEHRIAHERPDLRLLVSI